MVEDLASDVTYSGIGLLGLSILFLLRVMFKNGIFCCTPCGAHACIIDTNEGGANLEKTIKHIANDHYAREVSKVIKSEDSNEQSQHAEIVRTVQENFNTTPRKFDEFFGKNHTDTDATDVGERMYTDIEGGIHPIKSQHSRHY